MKPLTALWISVGLLAFLTARLGSVYVANGGLVRSLVGAPGRFVDLYPRSGGYGVAAWALPPFYGHLKMLRLRSRTRGLGMRSLGLIVATGRDYDYDWQSFRSPVPLSGTLEWHTFGGYLPARGEVFGITAAVSGREFACERRSGWAGWDEPLLFARWSLPFMGWR